MTTQKEILLSIFKDAVEKYKNSTKPNNYIARYIKKKLPFKMSDNDIYDTIYNISYSDKLCPVCKENNKKFISIGKGYNKTCSKICACYTDDCISSRDLSIGIPSVLKGKTYKEIYGDVIPKCGFQKGGNNIAKQPHIREKIRIGVKNSYTPELREIRRQAAYKTNFIQGYFKKNITDNFGNRFRSKLEATLSDILIKNNIDYVYERHVPLNNGKVKIVDFVIDNSIYIEVTGYAYNKWQIDMDKKLRWLRNSLDDNAIIILFTYNDKKNLLFMNTSKNMVGSNIFINTIEDENEIIKTINFAKSINKLNKGIKCIQ